jgi:hypothetical protein
MVKAVGWRELGVSQMLYGVRNLMQKTANGKKM